MLTKPAVRNDWHPQTKAPLWAVAISGSITQLEVVGT